MQVFLNSVDGRATAVACLLQVLQVYCAAAARQFCCRLHGCAHFNRAKYYIAAAIVQIVAFLCPH
eukprot:3667763-Pleurochrysis_carterae.AAC.1